jgi:hypothetical protein
MDWFVVIDAAGRLCTLVTAVLTLVAARRGRNTD